MALNNRLTTKLDKMTNKPQCPVCNKSCYTSDHYELKYIKTKRGTEIFIHTECVKKWGVS